MLKDHEKTAIQILAGSVLSPETLAVIFEQSQSVTYEYTGCGYFVTLVHPSLPCERIVCHEPLVVGESGGIQSGFVVFLQDNHLTLECHSWGETDVPETYRDQDVRVAAI